MAVTCAARPNTGDLTSRARSGLDVHRLAQAGKVGAQRVDGALFLCQLEYRMGITPRQSRFRLFARHIHPSRLS